MIHRKLKKYESLLFDLKFKYDSYIVAKKLQFLTLAKLIVIQTRHVRKSDIKIRKFNATVKVFKNTMQ